MRMIPVQSNNGSWKMPLPEEGLYDNSGHLFHHVATVTMMPLHMERLAKHGIIVERKHFTAEEDQRIRDNWEAFRKEHGLAKDDIIPLIGGGRGRNFIRSDCEFRASSNLWPQLCGGLPNRSAMTVSRRILSIFDPLNTTPGCRHFSEGEETLLLQLRKRYAVLEITKIMGKSFRGVSNRLHLLFAIRLFSHSERRRLWNTVFFTFASQFPDLEAFKFPLASKIEWHRISINMSRSKDVLKKEWSLMVDELVQLQEEGVSFFDALEKVAPECATMSAAEMSEFVEIVLEVAPNLESLHLHELRKPISKAMQERGLSGFKTDRYSEFHFCRLRLGRMLCALRRRLLRPASLRLSLCTQLQLLSRCLRSLPSAQERKRFQLKRNHVIRTIGSLLSTKDRSWKMSGKLRKYIEREERGKKQK